MQIIRKEVTSILIFIFQGTGAVEGIWLDVTQSTYIYI